MLMFVRRRARYTHLGKPGTKHRDYQMHLCTLLYLRCLRMCQNFHIGGLEDHLVVAWKPLTETKTYGCLIQIVNVPAAARIGLYKEFLSYDSSQRMIIRTSTGEVIPLEDVRNVLYTNRLLPSGDDFLDSECNIRGLLDSGGKCARLRPPRGGPPSPHASPVVTLLCHGQGNVLDLRRFIMFEITTDASLRVEIYERLLSRVTHWWDSERRYGYLTDKSVIKFTTGFQRKLQLFPCGELGVLDDGEEWGEKAVFLRAVAAARLEEVRDHVARGASLSWEDDDGNGALHVAAQADAASVMTVLLDAGLDMESRNDAGKTPLLVAASAGSPEVFTLLLRRGAYVTARDVRRNSAAHLAAVCPKADVLRLLLEDAKRRTDASPLLLFDARNVIGLTPFLQATKAGRIDNVRMLLEAGARDDVYDRHRLCALHLAVVNHHPELVTFLLEREAPLEARSLRGMTPLLAAASVGDVAILEILRGRGATFESVDTSSLNAVHYAALQGHNETVRYLVASGMDVNSHTWDFRTALHFASSHGRLSTVRLLLELGACVHDRDRGGVTALHLAAVGGYVDILKTLIAAGASVRTRDLSGGTALHEASTRGHLECVRILVEARAGVDVRTRDTAFSPLHCAARNGHLEVAEFLLFAGSYVHRRDGRGETALHMAARVGNLPLAKYLVEKGCGAADLNVLRETPLHVAAQAGHEEVAKFLIKNGANMNGEDALGRMPVDHAVQCDHIKVVINFSNKFMKIKIGIYCT